MASIARPPCDEAAILAGTCARPAITNGAWILAATILGSSMAFIDGTVVNVALPATLQSPGRGDDTLINMNESDRCFLLNELRRSRDALFSALEGVSEAQTGWKQTSQWSILECVEHVAITERGMFRLVTEATSSAESMDRTGQEQAIREFAANRMSKRDAPENARPTGRYATLELAAQRFGEARERTAGYVAQCPHDLRMRVVNHPAFGPITAWECLLVMIGHAERHAQQIREIREQPALLALAAHT